MVSNLPRSYAPHREARRGRNLCSNCHKELGHADTCRDCKECRKHSSTLRRAVNGQKFNDFLAEDKCLTGCEECGYGKGEKHKACALHYDHLNKQEKNIEISYIAKNASAFETAMKKYRVERPKCRVLCANCHSLHSKEQLQESKEQTLTEAIQYFANFQHRELRPQIKSWLYELINIKQEPPSQMELQL